jgi:hypothetical protein
MVNVKVITSLKHHNTKRYGEVEVKLSGYFNSALDGGELSSSGCGLLYFRKKIFLYQLARRVVGPYGRSGRSGEGKNFFSCLE